MTVALSPPCRRWDDAVVTGSTPVPAATRRRARRAPVRGLVALLAAGLVGGCFNYDAGEPPGVRFENQWPSAVVVDVVGARPQYLETNSAVKFVTDGCFTDGFTLEEHDGGRRVVESTEPVCAPTTVVLERDGSMTITDREGTRSVPPAEPKE